MDDFSNLDTRNPLLDEKPIDDAIRLWQGIRDGAPLPDGYCQPDVLLSLLPPAPTNTARE
jgi:hypothetical protein